MKNIKYLIIFLVLASIGLGGCKHKACKGKLCISGQVLDETTNQPVVGATVLLGIEKDGGGTFTLRDFVDSFVTNEKGEYQFFIDTLSREGTYTLLPKHKKFFKPQYWENISEYDGAVRKTLFLHPEAWLKLHIKNVNPYNMDDKLRLYTEWFSISFYGDKVDTITKAYRVKGNIEISAQALIFHNSNKGSVKYYKTYCPDNDTTLLEIFY